MVAISVQERLRAMTVSCQACRAEGKPDLSLLSVAVCCLSDMIRAEDILCALPYQIAGCEIGHSLILIAWYIKSDECIQNANDHGLMLMSRNLSAGNNDYNPCT